MSCSDLKQESLSPRAKPSSPSPTSPTDKADKSDLRTARLVEQDYKSSISTEELYQRLPDYLKNEAEYTVSSTVHILPQETFQKFCRIHSIGKRLNDEIHRNKRISNPYFVRNTLQFFGIEKAGSNIKTKKRRLLAESFDEDCIEAFRTFRKQRHGSQHSLTDTSQPQTKA